MLSWIANYILFLEDFAEPIEIKFGTINTLYVSDNMLCNISQSITNKEFPFPIIKK